MTDAQYKKFLPHRASMAETKAYMRCLRAALGLAQGYTKQELMKPFVVAHIVPNLDAPEMRQALISNSLRDMGLLFETTSAQPQIAQQAQQQQPLALSDGAMQMAAEDAADTGEPYREDEYPDYESDALPWEDVPAPEPPQGIVCEGCGRQITEAKGTSGQKWTPEAIRDFSTRRFGRCLCPDCQKANSRRNGR